MAVVYTVQVVHFSGNGDYKNGEDVMFEDYSSAIKFMNDKNNEFAETATKEDYSMVMRPKLVDI
jgi:hypothetical protein